MHKVSLLPAASDQALWAQWLAIIPFIPMLLKMVRCPGTSYLQSGHGPVKVSPLHWLTLPDPSTQCQLSNGHLYAEGTSHGQVLMMPTSRPLRQVSKTIVLPLLHLCRGKQSFLSQPHHNSTLQCQLWMWKVLEAGPHVIFCPA